MDSIEDFTTRADIIKFEAYIVRRYMLISGDSMRSLAKATGVSHPHVVGWCKGTRRVPKRLRSFFDFDYFKMGVNYDDF